MNIQKKRKTSEQVKVLCIVHASAMCSPRNEEKSTDGGYIIANEVAEQKGYFQRVAKQPYFPARVQK